MRSVAVNATQAPVIFDASRIAISVRALLTTTFEFRIQVSPLFGLFGNDAR